MLAGGTDPLYRDLLGSNYAPVSRLEVWRSGVRVDEFGQDGVPVTEANVSATLTSKMTRELSFTVHESLYPETPDALLSPYGNEIRAFAGVKGFGGADYIWPVFRGRIDTVEYDQSGEVGIRCVDKAADIGDSYFRLPRNSTVGQPILTTFADLVQEAIPDAEFGDSADDIWEVCPKLTWENDRAQALDELAKGAACFWYTLSDGSFVMRRIPWAHPGDPVLTLSTGQGGTIRGWSIRKSRQGVANVVTVFGERSDGTPPVSATVSDTNVDSPTNVNGPFGVKGLMLHAQSSVTSGQAYHVARTALLRSRTIRETWQTTLVPDASLELGDIIMLQARQRFSTQVVASFQLPLVGNDQMTVSWRALEV